MRPIALVAHWAIVGIVLIVLLGGVWDSVIRGVNDLHRTCTEDMACWDCETMGNHVCGDQRAVLS
jgi:hypothetical protein